MFLYYLGPLQGVAGGLVDPPGGVRGEVGVPPHSRAQQGGVGAEEEGVLPWQREQEEEEEEGEGQVQCRLAVLEEEEEEGQGP